MRNLILALALACGLQAQTNGHTQQYFYNGSNLQYVCDAPASVPNTSVSFAAGTLTNVVVSSNTGTITTSVAHQLWPGAQVAITGSSALGLNSSYTVLTVPSTTTYTITTSGVADGTYTTGITINTNSPLLTASVWYVSVFYYTGANLTSVYPGGGSLSIAFRARCSDRALY